MINNKNVTIVKITLNGLAQCLFIYLFWNTISLFSFCIWGKQLFLLFYYYAANLSTSHIFMKCKKLMFCLISYSCYHKQRKWLALLGVIFNTAQCIISNLFLKVPCYAFDSDGKKHDLNPLIKLSDGYLVDDPDDEIDFYINICRSLSELL